MSRFLLLTLLSSFLIEGGQPSAVAQTSCQERADEWAEEATTFAAEEDWRAAVSSQEALVDCFPSDYLYVLTLGYYRLQAGDDEGAEQAYEEALRLSDGQSLDAQRGLALAAAATDERSEPDDGWLFVGLSGGLFTRGPSTSQIASVSGGAGAREGHGTTLTYRTTMTDSVTLGDGTTQEATTEHHLWASTLMAQGALRGSATYGLLLVREGERETRHVLGMSVDAPAPLHLESNVVFGDAIASNTLLRGIITLARSHVFLHPLGSIHSSEGGDWTARLGGEIHLVYAPLSVRTGAWFGAAERPVFAASHTAYTASGRLRTELWAGASLVLGGWLADLTFSRQRFDQTDLTSNTSVILFTLSHSF